MKGNGEVEIGYGIDPNYQNRGYTTETVQTLINWGFQEPQCTAVIADPHKSNFASNRALKKVGMRVYEETDNHLFWRVDR